MVKVQIISENMDTKFRFYAVPLIVPTELIEDSAAFISEQVENYRKSNPNTRVLVLYENLEVNNG